MILSFCCKFEVKVNETENGDYYSCLNCNLPCRTFSVLSFHDMINLWRSENVQKIQISPLDGRFGSYDYVCDF